MIFLCFIKCSVEAMITSQRPNNTPIVFVVHILCEIDQIHQMRLYEHITQSAEVVVLEIVDWIFLCFNVKMPFYYPPQCPKDIAARVSSAYCVRRSHYCRLWRTVHDLAVFWARASKYARWRDARRVPPVINTNSNDKFCCISSKKNSFSRVFFFQNRQNFVMIELRSKQQIRQCFPFMH